MDNKYLAIISSKEPPEAKEAKELWEYHKNKTLPEDQTLREALLKYINPVSRHILYAFLIADIESEQICSILKIKPQVLEKFIEYFYDCEALKDRLDKIVFYTEVEDKLDKFVRPILRAACFGKREYLILFFAPEHLNLNELLQNLVSDLLHVVHGLDRKLIRDYTQYVNALAKVIELADKFKGSDSEDNILSKIKFTIEEQELNISLQVDNEKII